MKNIKVKIFFIAFGVLIIGLLMKNNSYASSLPVVNIQGDISEMTLEKNEVQYVLSYNDSESGLSFTKPVTMKLQGSSTLNYPKRNFTIKIFSDDTYTKKEKIDMGKGWGKSNKYCLKADVIDKTHARNVVSSKLAAKVNEKYGLFEDTPNHGLIDGFPVQVNVNGSFYGLYTWNIPKDAWVWNIDKSNVNNIVIQGNTTNSYTSFIDEVEDTKTLEQAAWEIEEGTDTEENIKAKLNRLTHFISTSTDEEFKNNLENYINKDALLNYLALMYVSQATDNVGKNLILVTYDGEVWYPSLYDLDTTWGTRFKGNDGMNHDGKCEDYYWLPEGEYIHTEKVWGNHDNVLLNRFIDLFPDEFAQRYFELRKDVLSYDKIKEEFENFCGGIPEEVYQQEFSKWGYIPEYGRWDTTQIYGSDDSFLEIRLPYVDDVMYDKYTYEPQLTIQYSTEGKTNQNVVATAIANRNDIEFNNEENQHTFSQNGEYTFQAMDYKGNLVSSNAEVTWIDKEAPVITGPIYSTQEPTNQNIEVTITANEEIQPVEGWTLSTDKKTITKVYSENATEEVTIKDLAGNQVTVNVVIANIDKTAPELQVNYSPTTPTNQSVEVTIVSDKEMQEVEGWTLSTDKKTLTKIYTENVESEGVVVKDLVGNTSTVTVQINNIDKTGPVVTGPRYSTTELTKEDVVVIITTDEKIQEVEGWSLSTDQKTLTKIYENNVNEEVTLKDLLGNETKVNVVIANIDKAGPVITGPNYSVTEATSGNVEVTITADERIQGIEGWTLSTDKKTITKTYENNVSEEVTIKDLLGNETKVNVVIGNIDKTGPVITGPNYSITETTNGNVEVTIIANEEVQPIEGWTLSTDKKTLTKTYEENVNEEVSVKDLLGNETKVNVVISNIDKTSPIINVDPNECSICKTKSIVITAIKGQADLSNENEYEYYLSSSDNTLTGGQWTSYTSGTAFTIGSEITGTRYLFVKRIKDQANNVSTKNGTEQTIDGVTYLRFGEYVFDNTAPEVVNSSCSITELTNQNVVVTITVNEEIQPIEGWTLSTDKKTLTRTYENNVNEEVTIKDLLGNESKVNVVIANIDKTAPEVVNSICSITEPTNQNVEVTITVNEEIQPVEGWTLSTDKKTITKVYSENTTEEVIIKDLAGNQVTGNVVITNIDKTAPEITGPNYSITELTNQNVVATITSNEEVQPIEGWTLSTDKKTLTRTYENNVNEELIIKDLVGNETRVNVVINNIAKTSPTINVEPTGCTVCKTKSIVITATKGQADLSNENEYEYYLSSSDNTLTGGQWTSYTSGTAFTIGSEITGTRYLFVKRIKDQANNVSTKNGTEQTIDGVTYLRFGEYVFDNTAPEVVNSSCSITELTNQNVVVTITVNEEIQPIEGWTLSTDKKTLTRTYENNVNEEVTIKDLAGNQVTGDVVIANIDKTAPVVVNSSCSITEPTNQNVEVTIKVNEEIQPVEGWTLSTDKKTITKVYSENATEEVTIKDLAGNQVTGNVVIANIDKTAPVITGPSYSTTEATNGNITVTITANEEVQPIEGWTLSTDKKTLTKTYYDNTLEIITVKDLVGNSKTVSVEIENIDKTGPTFIGPSYSTTEATNGNITVTITSNEELQAIEGWTLSADKKILTKVYSENTTEQVIIKDLVGNQKTLNIEIGNIDKTGPSIIGPSYSTTVETNNSVNVTIVSNEEIQGVEGWTLSSDKKTLTKTYNENTAEIVTVKDLVGNETRITVTVNNIKDEEPEYTDDDNDNNYESNNDSDSERSGSYNNSSKKETNIQSKDTSTSDKIIPQTGVFEITGLLIIIALGISAFLYIKKKQLDKQV